MQKKGKPSVPKMVDEILDSRPFIQDLFRMDAVNYSGVARHLVPEIQRRLGKDKTNIEAVMMAVKRYGNSIKGDGVSDKIRGIVSKCSLFAKNDMIQITFMKSRKTYGIVQKIQDKVDYMRGEVLYVLQSTSEIEIVTERKIAAEFLRQFESSDILHKEDNLALVGVKIPEETIKVPGVICHFSGFLAVNGISIIDTISTFTEITYIISDKDASKAYVILDDVIKGERTKSPY